jgi:hypothetical protein
MGWVSDARADSAFRPERNVAPSASQFVTALFSQFDHAGLTRLIILTMALLRWPTRSR